MMRKDLITISLSVFLAGCSFVPEYAEPVYQGPETWSSSHVDASRNTGLTEWWTLFDNQALTEHVHEALANNAEIKGGLFRIEQARAQAKIAGAPLFPTILAGGSASRNKSASGVQGNDPSGLYSTDASFAYEIDLWGKNRAARDSARALADASQFDFAALALIVSSDTAQAYASILALNDRIRIAEENIANLEEVLRLVEFKYRTGALTAFEQAQQRTVLNSAAAALAELKRQRQGSVNQIAVLLGKAPESIEPGLHGLTTLTVPDLHPSVPSSVIQARPDIRASEARLVSANFDIGVARAAYFPRLDLGAGASLVSNHISGPLQDGSNLLAALSAPIFRGGAIAGGVERAEAVRNSLLEQYRQIVLIAFREVEDALIGLVQGKARRDALLTAADEAKRAYDIARKRFELGAIEFILLLDSQRVFLQTQDNLVQAELNYLLSGISLFKALGGGWQEWIEKVGRETSSF